MKVFLCSMIVSILCLCTNYANGVVGCWQQCERTMNEKLKDDPNTKYFSDMYATKQTWLPCIKNFLNSTGIAPSFVGNKEMWTKLCTIGTEAENCINPCTDISEQGRKDFKNGLAFFKLGCSEDFKTSIGCLIHVHKQNPEACRTKCGPMANKLTVYIASFEANPGVQVRPSKEVMESGCKYLNCRLSCRKPNIISNCQEKGFEQAKIMTSALATYAKARFGKRIADWPQICNADKVIAPSAN